MDTQSATKSFVFSAKQLSLVATPSKHLEFLPFQIVQKTTKKDSVQSSLPLRPQLESSGPGRALEGTLGTPSGNQTI